MGKGLGCLAVLSIGVGLVLVFLGLNAISNPGLTLGYLTPAPVDWGKVWGYWIVGGIFVLGPVAFFAWSAITLKRTHPGMTLKEIEALDADSAPAKAGYIEVTPTSKWCTQCSPPFHTGQNSRIPVGIGSVWQCPRCKRRWKLQAHELNRGAGRTRGSSWRAVDV